MLLNAVSLAVLCFAGNFESGAGLTLARTRINLQDWDYWEPEPWGPSASGPTPWTFNPPWAFTSHPSEPWSRWEIHSPWEANPWEPGPWNRFGPERLDTRPATLGSSRWQPRPQGSGSNQRNPLQFNPGASAASNAAYCNLNSGHTMCIYPGPSTSCASATQFRELSADAKTAILDKHNELRAKVANGQESGQPAASNMQKLVWNTELEAISQRLADQCVFAHDSVRNKIDGTSVGQNLYISFNSAQQTESTVQASMVNSVQAWYDEVTNPGFDSANISPFVFSSGAGHYTQVVWAATTEVGCGQVYYLEDNWYKTLIVCNYAVAGNLQGGTMYQQGTACSGCTADQTCDNGLCV